MTPDEVVENLEEIKAYRLEHSPAYLDYYNALSSAISFIQDYQKLREKLTVENIDTEISVVLADYALNGQGSRNLTNDLSQAIVTYLQQPTEH